MSTYETRLLALCDIGPTVRSLLAQFCADRPDPRAIAAFFAAVDFEALSSEVTCMAAALCAAADYSGTPPALVPRLRGITKYIHTLNAGQLAGLWAFARQCQEAGIPLLAKHATALRLAAPHSPQRHLWQTETAVPSNAFDQALSLAREAGYDIDVIRSGSSAALRKGVTQNILLTSGNEEDFAFVRLLERSGSALLLPAPEDLLLHLLEEGFRLLYQPNPGKGLLLWLMDVQCVLSGPVDWQHTAALAAKNGFSRQAGIMLDIYLLLAQRPLPKAASCFSHASEAGPLLPLLEQRRAIPPGTKRLRRLWLLARLEQPDHFSASAAFFTRQLAAALRCKLTSPD